MATNWTLVSSPDRMIGSVVFGQNSLAQFNRAYERFLEGLMSATIRRIEVSQSLISGGLADLDLLTQARTPSGFIEAELEITRRRSERLAEAIRTSVEDLYRGWIETTACVQPLADRNAAAVTAESVEQDGADGLATTNVTR
jgi:hypothetical protein